MRLPVTTVAELGIRPQCGIYWALRVISGHVCASPVFVEVTLML